MGETEGNLQERKREGRRGRGMGREEEGLREGKR
jgi:hypothetical protein